LRPLHWDKDDLQYTELEVPMAKVMSEVGTGSAYHKMEAMPKTSSF